MWHQKRRALKQPQALMPCTCSLLAGAHGQAQAPPHHFDSSLFDGVPHAAWRQQPLLSFVLKPFARCCHMTLALMHVMHATTSTAGAQGTNEGSAASPAQGAQQGEKQSEVEPQQGEGGERVPAQQVVLLITMKQLQAAATGVLAPAGPEPCAPAHADGWAEKAASCCLVMGMPTQAGAAPQARRLPTIGRCSHRCCNCRL